MRHLVAALMVASLTAEHGLAQTSDPPVPAHIQQAAGATIDYVDALLKHERPDAIWRTGRLLNAPPQELQSAVLEARQTAIRERAYLDALAKPASEGDDTYVALSLAGLRQLAAERLDSLDAALLALDGMLSSRAEGNCAAFDAHIVELNASRQAMVRSRLSGNASSLKSFMLPFSGRKPAPFPAPFPGTQDMNVVRARQMADELAGVLQCPALPPELTFSIHARLMLRGIVQVRVVSISDESMRKPVQERFSGFTVETPSYYSGWSMLGEPVLYTWANNQLRLSESK